MSKAAKLASHEGLPKAFGVYNQDTNTVFSGIGINVSSVTDVATGKFDVVMTNNFSAISTIAHQITGNRDSNTSFVVAGNGPDLLSSSPRTFTTGNFPYVVGYVSSSGYNTDRQRVSHSLAGPLA
tara:strand:+ start:131 stop:505 length:375 start_codon:yes stop_codon:yes gene_type:complete